MKDFGKLFSRPYNSVLTQDDEQQQQHDQQLALDSAHDKTTTTTTTECPVTIMPRMSLSIKEQNRRSLKANRSMNPAGILSSFFNERKNNKRARSPKCAFLLLAIGVLAIITAVMVKILHPYDLIFKWKLIMSEGGEIYNLWEKPPVDLYIKVYLFNITNAEAFMAGREKMNVVQVGPYVYKELMTHENVTFNANNTMTAYPSHPLVWQEHLSEGHKEDDEVVMVNIAMLAIAHLMAEKPYVLRMMLNTLFLTSKSQPIVRMTAKEFMFGYKTPIATLGNTFLPDWIYFEKVGLIDRMYDFSSDYETFYNGIPNPSIAGLYATYMGKTNLPQWNGEHCSNIELASDGTKFKSYIQPNESVKFFRKSMCRPINLYSTGKAKKRGSLTGYQFVFEENAFDNGAFNEKNKCFCRHGHCQPIGLIDVTDCYYGFPISLSYPHFMNGEIGLQNNITGLMPDKEKHSSEFIIEPKSGLPLSLTAKVQINMHFENLNAFRKVAAFSHLTVPMLWFDITLPELPGELNRLFTFYINILPYIDDVFFWGGLLLGVSLLVYAVTRATISMSNIIKLDNVNEGKFCKANILRAATAANSNTISNKVYNPCEMKLIHMDEKHHQESPLLEATPERAPVITRIADVDNNERQLYNEIVDVGRNDRRHSSFALELEPAISDNECCCSNISDEDHECDTATLSHNSSTTCSCELSTSDDHDDQHHHHLHHQSCDKCEIINMVNSNKTLSHTNNEHST